MEERTETMANNQTPEMVGAIYGEYRDGVNEKRPIYGRKYTMTHSDETGERFVTVGIDYADDKIDPRMRDEVLLKIAKEGRKLAFVGNVLVDGEEIAEESAKKRYDIFLRQMPVALSAVRGADKEFFEANPFLDELEVLIWYRSRNPEFNQFYNYGTMGSYKEF